MKKKKILIATSNKGKFEEMRVFLEDLPFDFLSLDDLPEKFDEPEETEDTLLGNAILKAKYYGEKTGLISLADDGGLFLDAFEGWPGVQSARVSDTDEGRVQTVLGKLKTTDNRKAYFRVKLAIYDPNNKNIFVTGGETEGEILEKPFEGGVNNYAYNPIFYMPDVGKVYAEMTREEKNSVSHRGKALSQVVYFLQNTYTSKNIIVPLALVVKGGKIMATLRNDPHNLEYHKKWEFPGGSLEMGETMEENLIRETKEESGYDVEIVSLLNYVHTEDRPDKNYQVCLVPYLCRIVGGDGKYSDHEVLDLKFFDFEDFMKLDLLPANDVMFTKVLDQIKSLIKEHNL